jgi:ABC-type phosphate transport system substrate-binding protein
VAAVVLAAVLGLAACTSGAASTPASAAQRLSETGSSLMAPLFALWGPAYHARSR